MAKKILITEDDSDIRYILNLALKRAGYEVELLPLTDTLIDPNKHNWPDLFIVDNVFPTVDGLRVCKFLKGNNETKDIPIIMMSTDHRLKTQAEEIGVDDFIDKPFDLKDLLAFVKKNVSGIPTD